MHSPHNMSMTTFNQDVNTHLKSTLKANEQLVAKVSNNALITKAMGGGDVTGDNNFTLVELTQEDSYFMP